MTSRKEHSHGSKSYRSEKHGPRGHHARTGHEGGGLLLIAACEEGTVNLVITKSISRFARDTLDALSYIRKLKTLNVPTIFGKESASTPEASGEPMVTILASVARQESASISQNVRMGIGFGFQEGRGRANFSSFPGCRRADEPGTHEIVPAEADVVRRPGHHQ